MIQAAGSLIMWGCFLEHLGTLVPTEPCLNTTPCPSIVADYVFPFTTTVYPSSHGCFQQEDSMLSHCTQMAFTRTTSQSNSAPSGCFGPVDSHHEGAADKFAATA